MGNTGIWALAWAISASSTAQSLSASPALTLERRYSLNDCLAEKAFRQPQGEKLAARGGMVAGVISPGPTGQRSALVVFNLEKDGCWTYLFGEEEFFDVATDGTNIAVLTAAVTGSGGARLTVLSSEGKIIETIEDQPDLSQIAFAGRRLIGFTRAGVARDLHSRNNVRDLGAGPEMYGSARFLALGTPDGDIESVDRQTGIIRRFKQGASAPDRKPLTHDAVTQSKAVSAANPAPPNGETRLILAAAGGSDSSRYYLLSGFRAEEGAPVVTVSGDGARAADSLRIPLTLGAGGAYQIPVSLAVDSGRLLMLDSTANVTIFHLPKTTVQ